MGEKAKEIEKNVREMSISTESQHEHQTFTQARSDKTKRELKVEMWRFLRGFIKCFK